MHNINAITSIMLYAHSTQKKEALTDNFIDKVEKTKVL